MAVMQLFVEYYKKQGVVPEGQWEEFMEVLKTPLPTTFRINGTGKFATDLRDKLESDFLSNFNKDPIMVCVTAVGCSLWFLWCTCCLTGHKCSLMRMVVTMFTFRSCIG